MYKWLEKPLNVCSYKWIWDGKVPFEIQIFLWQLFQDVVLTRHVMKQRKWPGNTCCSFCISVDLVNIFSLLARLLGLSGELLGLCWVQICVLIINGSIISWC